MRICDVCAEGNFLFTRYNRDCAIGNHAQVEVGDYIVGISGFTGDPVEMLTKYADWLEARLANKQGIHLVIMVAN